MAKHKEGDIVWHDHSENGGLCRIYKIEWWDQPAPEMFGNEKLPWYFIRNLVTYEKYEEFEPRLLKDNVGQLLYG